MVKKTERKSQYFRAARLLQLGGIRRMPQHPEDALPIMRASGQWEKLGIRPWGRYFAALIALTIAGMCLLSIALLYLLGAIPPRAQQISDLRLSTHFNDTPLTSGAVVGDDWVLVGTAGAGIQAYRRSSGPLGLWHTYNNLNTSQALPANGVIRNMGGDKNGAWAVTGGYGLVWSSPDLQQWVPLVGENGFSVSPAQKDITTTALSPDRRWLAVGTRTTIGLYDTELRNWLGETKQPIQAELLAVFQNKVFAATSQGLATFEVNSKNPGELVQSPTLSLPGLSFVSLRADEKWLLAVTRSNGLLGLSAQDGARWQWLVGENGLNVPNVSEKDITAVALDSQTLWVAVNNLVGRYDLKTHDWFSATPDGLKILGLASFENTGWVGTQKGLYRLENGKWTQIQQVSGTGGKQLLSSSDRLWVVTADRGLGFITPNGEWQSAIDAGSFSQGDNPKVTSVTVFNNEFWVASANAGIASYNWKSRRWTDRRQGLKSQEMTQLLAGSEQLWTLTATHDVFKWDGTSWQLLPDLSGQKLVLQGSTTWLMKTSGELVQLSTAGTPTFFKSVVFKPTTLGGFAQVSNTTVAVATREGLLQYHTDTHNWEKLNENETVAVAVGEGHLLHATSDGGLLADAPLVPQVSNQYSPGTLITAARDTQRVWLSDGDALLTYNLTTRSLEKIADSPEGKIVQLRSGEGILVALAGGSGQFHLYTFDPDQKKWLSLSSNRVERFAVYRNQVFYLENGGAFGVWDKNGGQTGWFSGSFKGLADLSAIVKTTDSNFWALSPSAGLALYTPKRGNWLSVQLAAPRQIVSSGADSILVTAIGGLYQLTAQTGKPTAVAGGAGVIALTLHVGQAYALTPDTLYRWSGTSLEKLGALSADGAASGLASGDNLLWIRQRDQVIGYQVQGNQLVKNRQVDLPSQTAGGQLYSGSGQVPLYFGNNQTCWQLESNLWKSCPQPDWLTQPKQTIQDSFGRFNWKIAPATVTFDPPAAVETDHFASDRITMLQVNTQGKIFLSATIGEWTVESGTLEQRSFSEVQTGSISHSFSLPGDPWTWKITPSTKNSSDQLEIYATAQPGIVRKVYQQRFGDEAVISLAYFDRRFWMGTRTGLWSISNFELDFSKRVGVPDLGSGEITGLFTTPDALYANSSSGRAWKYQNQVWSSITNIPYEQLARFSNEQEPLFWWTPEGMLAAAFNNETKPRFLFDTLLSYTADSQSLWLGNSQGVVKASLQNGAIRYDRIEPFKGAAPSSLDMAVDQGEVYVRMRPSGTLSKLSTSGWVSPSPVNPLTAGYTLPARLPDSPLNWQTTDAEILPVLDGAPLSWVDGRLSIDAIQDAVLKDNILWLAGKSGLQTYTLENQGLGNLSALPEAALRAPASAIGTLQDGSMWVQTEDNQFLLVQQNGRQLTSGGTAKSSARRRNGVILQNGAWSSTTVSYDQPMLAIDSSALPSLFNSNGRFYFDQVYDVTHYPGGFALATEAGLIQYAEAPFERMQLIGFSGKTIVKRIVFEENFLWTQVENKIQRLDGTRWQEENRPDIFWPIFAQLNENGWGPWHLDPVGDQSLIQVSSMEFSSSLFGINHKFKFDNVLDAIPQDHKTWLLTEAGWREAVRLPDGFNLYPPVVPLEDRPREPEAERQNEFFILEPKNKQTFSCKIVDVPECAKIEMPEITTALLGKVEVWGDDGGVKLIRSGSVISEIRFAAQSFWPLDINLGFTHQALQPPVDLFEDEHSIWIVTPDNLVNLLKAKVKIQ